MIYNANNNRRIYSDDAIQAFTDIIVLEFNAKSFELKTDGKLYRIASNNDKSSSRSIAYKCYINDEVPFLYVKNWETREEARIVCINKTHQTQTTKTISFNGNFNKSLEEKALHAQYIEKQQQITALFNIFDNVYRSHQFNRHPYLILKNVLAVGIKYHNKSNSIQIPLRDVDNKIWSKQFIKCDAYGNVVKGFEKGAKTAGMFHIVGVGKIKSTDVIFFAEGYATAVSVFMSTGMPCVMCCQVGNLENVIKKFITKYSNRLVIAADNDTPKFIANTLQNIGLEEAVKVAKKYKLAVISPERNGEDFNDMTVRIGIKPTGDYIQKQLEMSNNESIKTADKYLYKLYSTIE